MGIMLLKLIPKRQLQDDFKGHQRGDDLLDVCSTLSRILETEYISVFNQLLRYSYFKDNEDEDEDDVVGTHYRTPTSRPFERSRAS
ncbi:hypothetical protein JTE90_002023 [Oedothorax gibbosus]|uniref:Uncharacterized protein n=1 Tax=Oedothorax gibbosus TaxID=931172 RepID=A0AAV6UN00_9ARAC|nr:hypothetical protein JTE90_002023 [Oedothorax gibbosus]